MCIHLKVASLVKDNVYACSCKLEWEVHMIGLQAQKWLYAMPSTEDPLKGVRACVC